jgi:hypothetical protein
MSTLKQLDEELTKALETAKKNLDDIHPRVHGSWAGTINEAKIKARALTKEYKETLLRNSVAIFLEGDPTKTAELAKLVKDEGGLVVNAAALYERLGKAVEATLSERESRTGVEWGVTHTHRLHLGLQEIMHEVGVTEMPMPPQSGRPLVKNLSEISSHIRSILSEADGGILNKLYLEEQLLQAARLIRYNGSVAPVFVVNVDPGEVYNLSKAFGKGSATVPVAAEDVIDKEFLGKTLKTISSMNRKSNKKSEGERNDR